MATYKGKIKQKTADGADILHPETEADVVSYSNTIGSSSVTNVKDALDTIITAGVGVTGVKGNAETDYRTGDVNLTPANIGAVAANAAITAQSGGKAKIKYDSKGLVTGYGTLDANDIPTLTLAKISDAGAAAAKGVATSITQSSTNNDLATAKAVYDAIDSLPEPMVFKGTLGTNGSITALQPPAAAKEGWTYKVIEDGEYSYSKQGGTTGTVIAEEGDVVINNGTDWVLIPAGDDVEDTWRNIKVNGTELLNNGITGGAVNFKNGGNITVSGSGNDITLGVASGYSIPSTTDQSTWSAKQDALAAQTAYSEKGTTTKVPQITTNSLGQVTLIEEKNIAFPDITVASTGSGNAITAIAVDSSNKHKLNITKGTTFLTSHQSLANYVDKTSGQSISGYKIFTNGDGVQIGNNGGTNEYAVVYKNALKLLGDSATGSTAVKTVYGKNNITYVHYQDPSTTNVLQLPRKSGTLAVTSDIPDVTGFASKVSMTAGTYSAVAVNSEGIVTSGGQVFEVINNGATPSVVTGGLYFEKDA